MYYSLTGECEKKKNVYSVWPPSGILGGGDVYTGIPSLILDPEIDFLKFFSFFLSWLECADVKVGF